MMRIDREELNTTILSIYKKCKINNFPIDCMDVIKALGYKSKKYSELKPKKLQACMELSEDATIINDTVYYNDTKLKTRIRFSIMHEIGHEVLKIQEEFIADSFSSHFLAPRIAIHYSNCKNAADVMKYFDLSEMAANIAFNDYRKWHRDVSIKGMTATDKEMYNHFYQPSVNKFIWKVQRCDFCFSEDAYNGEILCPTCKIHELRKKTLASSCCDPREKDLDILRSAYLYSGL